MLDFTVLNIQTRFNLLPKMRLLVNLFVISFRLFLPIVAVNLLIRGKEGREYNLKLSELNHETIIFITELSLQFEPIGIK